MAEYEHGSMDVTEQQKAFAGLMKGAVLVAVFTALVLILSHRRNLNPPLHRAVLQASANAGTHCPGERRRRTGTQSGDFA